MKALAHIDSYDGNETKIVIETTKRELKTINDFLYTAEIEAIKNGCDNGRLSASKAREDISKILKGE